jgi:hypothetical protein
MLQDQSPDKTETMNFLERHLGDFQTTGCIRPSVKNVFFSLYLLKYYIEYNPGFTIFIGYSTSCQWIAHSGMYETRDATVTIIHQSTVAGSRVTNDNWCRPVTVLTITSMNR